MQKKNKTKQKKNLAKEEEKNFINRNILKSLELKKKSFFLNKIEKKRRER